MGACQHPEEELQQVFAGGAEPLSGRRYCGLCGALVFLDALPPGTGEHADAARAVSVLVRRVLAAR